MHDRDEIPYDEVSDLEKLQDELNIIYLNNVNKVFDLRYMCKFYIPYLIYLNILLIIINFLYHVFFNFKNIILRLYIRIN